MPWRRWSELSRVEHVDAYTRWSLYAVLVGFNALTLVGGAAQLHGAVDIAVLLGGGLAVTVVAFLALHDLLHPSRRLIGLLLAVGAAYLVVAEAAWPVPARGAAAIVTAGSVTLVVCLQPDERISFAAIAGT